MLVRATARVRGERGELSVLNPYMPQLYHRLRVRTAAGRRSERIRGDATYTHQLRAFVRAVRGESPMPTDAVDAIANMRVIDAVYESSGLFRRS